MSKRIETLIVSAVAFGIAASAANAQGAPERPAASSDALEEVVVTAEKRSENLQALPQTVTAVSADALLAQGVKDITDLSRVAPEVNVSIGQLTNVSVRGVRSASSGPSLDSANAVYVDGNYNARFTSLSGLFFDVERIEVLDGPQGTLYGRNSAGGAINIISAKPKFTFGGNGSVEAGNYGALQMNGAVNLPLGDTLAARFAYMSARHRGYFTDSGTDDLDITGARGELLWKPTESDSLLFTAAESTLGGKGSASTISSVLKNPTVTTTTTAGTTNGVLIPANTILAYNAACPTGATCTSQVVPINATDNPRHNAVLVGAADLNRLGTRNDALALQYDHTFGNFAVLTFQGSQMSNYSNNRLGTISGLQQNPLLVADSLFLTSGRPGVFAGNNYVDDKWSSQELRLTSIATTPLKWVLGLYHFQERLEPGANPSYIVNTTTTPGTSAGSVVIPPGSPIINQDIPQFLGTTNARSVFGQATWTPDAFARIHLTGGARYNTEHKRGVQTVYPAAGPIAQALFPPTGIFDQANTWSAITYKANLSFDLTDHNLLYVDKSTGFQAGGYGYGTTPAYGPTHIWAWEIGSKNRFLDNRLQVNLSAWYYQYSNQTANITDSLLVQFAPPPAPPSPFNFITVANAGTSVIRGQNIDVQWNVTADDRLNFNVQHINAKYADFDLTARYLAIAARLNKPFAALYPGYSTTGDQSGPSFNYNGTQVGGSPDYAVVASYSHEFHAGDFDYTPLLTYRYKGKVRNGNQQAPNFPPGEDFYVLPAASTLDFNFGISPTDGKYNVSLFVRNLSNKLVVTGRGYSNNSGGLSPAASLYAYTTESYAAPRTYGIAASASF